ncbi:MAG: hypothetical protein IJK97_06255, partial [Thermoguttaceae bacterium]|nr:hypothetical protein [Thermoguttaceae bacterium]
MTVCGSPGTSLPSGAWNVKVNSIPEAVPAESDHHATGVWAISKASRSVLYTISPPVLSQPQDLGRGAGFVFLRIHGEGEHGSAVRGQLGRRLVPAAQLAPQNSKHPALWFR